MTRFQWCLDIHMGKFGSGYFWAKRSHMNTPTSMKPSHSASTCLWRWNRQSVLKRRHIKLRRWGITLSPSFLSGSGYFQAKLSHMNTPTSLKPSLSAPTCLWRWNRQCSETSAYKTQTPGNYPKESRKQNVCCIHGFMTSSCFISVLLMSGEGNVIHREFFSNVINGILSGDIAYNLVSISGKPNCCSY